MSVKLTYTAPADIDGEPEDVRELSIQQLGEALTQVSQLSAETLVQLRAAGAGREEGQWEATDEGFAAHELITHLRRALDSSKRLQQAV